VSWFVTGSANTSVPSAARASRSFMPSRSATRVMSMRPVRSRLTAMASAGLSTPCTSARGTTTRWLMIAAGDAD
jgi:hypothetical protein